MADTSEERLLSVIRASDAVVEEEGDSEDPVAIRRVGEALWRKAHALEELDRLDEAVGAWAELIARSVDGSSAGESPTVMQAMYWRARDLERLRRPGESLAAITELLECSPDLAEDGAPSLLMVRALALRARMLAAVGHLPEAIVCAESLIARIDEAPEPELRWRVTWMLNFQTRLLIAENSIDEALSVSARLPARLLDEPPESLAEQVDIAIDLGRFLVQTVPLSPRGVLQILGIALINAVDQAIDPRASRFVRQLLDRVARSAGRQGTMSGNGSGLVARVSATRRRADQARRIADTVILICGDSKDPDLGRAVATAHFIRGSALTAGGHLRAGNREMDAFLNRPDQDAVQAVQQLFGWLADDPGPLGELGHISAASARARMLADHDPEIARIAYEDALADRGATTAHPTLHRLLTRALRPQVDDSPPRWWRALRRRVARSTAGRT